MVEWDENVNACSQSKYLLECFCDPHQGISQIDRVQDCNKTQTDVATFSGQSDIILSATISIGRLCLYLCSATMAFSLSMLAPVRSATWNICCCWVSRNETKVHGKDYWKTKMLNFASFSIYNCLIPFPCSSRTQRLASLSPETNQLNDDEKTRVKVLQVDPFFEKRKMSFDIKLKTSI